eukprot:CAMPEP_0202921350 /NCGR_PEP_ID=MMETSP1392-20130828/77347_1 /ASSEMBLY_ACC=CAM_ASM_000868 /TAXON_ID=225041 /ORGANISM="Chlamydomonas chlamydogama, Strain SAG 11-48b" /LENGTH=107 /DNA_ID=CAMNT_0049614915 /DNA_START=400 /DNA_END=723 /DNA_ORIENTATION=+
MAHSSSRPCCSSASVRARSAERCCTPLRASGTAPLAPAELFPMRLDCPVAEWPRVTSALMPSHRGWSSGCVPHSTATPWPTWHLMAAAAPLTLSSGPSYSASTCTWG